MNIPIEELTIFQGGYEWYEKHGDGYRIVYFYPNNTYYNRCLFKNNRRIYDEFL